MPNYKISPAAENDLINIYLRGYRYWGVEVADSYQRQLISIFNLIVENPNMGRAVSIKPEMLRHEVKPYVIFYRQFSYGVRISRILYKNRVIEKHL